MNVLVINGSPKADRSNTLRLTEAFLDGLGEAEVRTVSVQQKKILPCRGCFCCWNKTPGSCVLEDDMASVIADQLWADVIVWSFPLYYFGVPGMLKNLIDRQLPMSLPFMTDRTDGQGSGSHPARYDMSGKRHVLISTCGFYSAEKNYDSVCAMFDHILGAGKYETVFCGQGELFRVPELRERTDAYLQWVRQAGQEFAAGGIAADTKRELSRLLYPKAVFERMADASWGIEEATGEKSDPSLTFTRQMAALYNPGSFDGKERVLEICYTDLGKTYQILLGASGSTVFTDGSRKATTRIDTPWEVWTAISRGELRGDAALAEGKYRVSGDFDLMIRWDTFFGSAQEEAPVKREKNPGMLTLLLPWIVFWAGAAMDAKLGALAALAVCLLTPLAMTGRVLTLYDRITVSAVGALSAAVLVTGTADRWILLGYLAFGLMWLISAFTREPVCAAYVKYSYGGEEALRNPIFMKTNRILAFGWGVSYLAIAASSLVLYRLGQKGTAMLILNAVTIAMGIFTGWFQKWYPAHVASGK